VASRPLYKGQQLKNEQANRKRKRVELRPGPAKRQQGLQGAVPASGGSSSGSEDENEDKASSSLILIYNSIRGYYSAINKL
jgi:hypothetical protein